MACVKCVRLENELLFSAKKQDLWQAVAASSCHKEAILYIKYAV